TAIDAPAIVRVGEDRGIYCPDGVVRKVPLGVTDPEVDTDGPIRRPIRRAAGDHPVVVQDVAGVALWKRPAPGKVAEPVLRLVVRPASRLRRGAPSGDGSCAREPRQ